MTSELVVVVPPMSAAASMRDGYYCWVQLVGSDQRAEIQIAGIDFTKASVIEDDIDDRFWSALLLDLKERTLLHLAMDEGDSILSTITVVSSDLARAATIAESREPLPDLTVEGAVF